MSSIEEAIEAICAHKPRKIVFMTGAGVSADSGIPTFRGPGGLWRNFRPEQLATPDAFRRDPVLVWEWYEWRRGLIRKAKPNIAHQSIARIADAVVVTHKGLSIEINPEMTAVSTACTHAIPMRAAEATPAIVEALLEVCE